MQSSAKIPQWNMSHIVSLISHKKCHSAFFMMKRTYKRTKQRRVMVSIPVYEYKAKQPRIGPSQWQYSKTWKKVAADKKKKSRNCGLTSIRQGLILLPQAWLLFCLYFMFAPLSLCTFQPVLAINLDIWVTHRQYFKRSKSSLLHAVLRHCQRILGEHPGLTEAVLLRQHEEHIIG